MFKRIIHALFHPSQPKHNHEFIPGSLVVEHESFGGFVTGQFITTCPHCNLKSQRKVAFLWDNQDRFEQAQRLTEKTGTDFVKYRTTLDQAKRECVEYKGD